MRGGRAESEQLREISPPSSFVECEQEVEDAGGRTPGSPIEGTPVSKRKHDDDDSSTRRVESGFESSHSSTSRREERQGCSTNASCRSDARKVDLTWLMVIA
ncbi:hypothetical protein Scep_027726 [Stephania cephalantha]|uniref:Uncharacterized protein n=1 Tax=Stephania cephalantha TaxID=152367 RepID=A0AAP0EGX9_9MAGN